MRRPAVVPPTSSQRTVGRARTKGSEVARQIVGIVRFGRLTCGVDATDGSSLRRQAAMWTTAGWGLETRQLAVRVVEGTATTLAKRHTCASHDITHDELKDILKGAGDERASTADSTTPQFLRGLRAYRKEPQWQRCPWRGIAAVNTLIVWRGVR